MLGGIFCSGNFNHLLIRLIPLTDKVRLECWTMDVSKLGGFDGDHGAFHVMDEQNMEGAGA